MQRSVPQTIRRSSITEAPIRKSGGLTFTILDIYYFTIHRIFYELNYIHIHSSVGSVALYHSYEYIFFDYNMHIFFPYKILVSQNHRVWGKKANSWEPLPAHSQGCWIFPLLPLAANPFLESARFLHVSELPTCHFSVCWFPSATY